MPLPLQLLRIILSVGKKRCNVEHDLSVPERIVQRLAPRLPKLRVQSTTVTVFFVFFRG